MTTSFRHGTCANDFVAGGGSTRGMLRAASICVVISPPVDGVGRTDDAPTDAVPEGVRLMSLWPRLQLPDRLTAWSAYRLVGLSFEREPRRNLAVESLFTVELCAV